ncbi:hypothetical protein ACFPC0_10585 [Streptomyces andamanensis]|uniref:Uncharacterized protein n=1 Tax=Streptomyces andamanensis TaxID=1565035 RepID=A0ABV8TCD1_9ACTN
MSSHGLPGTDVPADFGQMMQLAELLSEAELFVPPKLRGRMADIIALMVRARGMDVPLAVAFDELYEAKDGDVGKTARLQRALARRAGHRIDFVEHDRYHAIAVITLADGERHEVAYSIQDAIEMGYTDPSHPNAAHWLKQPENMLVARVTTRAVNWFCPEVLLGLGADAMHADDQAVNADTVVQVREERAAQVTEALALLELAGAQPNGAVRGNLIRQLFMECRGAMLLDYGVPDDPAVSVRHRLVAALVEADKLAAAQSAGDVEAADPGGGPKKLDDLRGLLAQQAQASETGVNGDEDAADKEAEQAARAEAPAPGPEGKPKRAPRKRAAAKNPEKKPKGTAAGADAPVPKKSRQTTQRPAKTSQDDTSSQVTPSGRPAARPSARPDGDRLPCGCLVDSVITAGVHSKDCADAPRGDVA